MKILVQPQREPAQVQELLLYDGTPYVGAAYVESQWISPPGPAATKYRVKLGPKKENHHPRRARTRRPAPRNGRADGESDPQFEDTPLLFPGPYRDGGCLPHVPLGRAAQHPNRDDDAVTFGKNGKDFVLTAGENAKRRCEVSRHRPAG